MKAIVVAAPTTGAGKTTVALALMAALRKRGLTVQPFKVGPDYIDPAYHKAVCGRPSINLDTWMTPDEFVRETFAYHTRDADVAVVEGVMGLFDGIGDAEGRGSTAHVAVLLDLHVVLVLDAYTGSESLAAALLGCERYNPRVKFSGAVLNRVAGEKQVATIRKAAAGRCETEIIGAMPNVNALSVPERHLGLVSVHERNLDRDTFDSLADMAEKHLNLDQILTVSDFIPIDTPAPPPDAEPRTRIGVARDEAFCFYYEDNLRLLRQVGADLVPFSPLHDEALPPDLNGLYLGGGFPEEFAPRLADNRAMVEAVRKFEGPILAECGGLMYLCEKLYDKEGNAHEMVGRVPGSTGLTDRIQEFGYREVTLTRDTLLGPRGAILRGHLFHWSAWRERSKSGWGIYQAGDTPFGYADSTTLASYFHFHLASNPEAARAFVDACAGFKQRI